MASQLGWNFERLRAAMGHEDYMTLQRYVRLAMERDLGQLGGWTEYIAMPPRVVPMRTWEQRLAWAGSGL